MRELDPRELATVLAALRYWQDEMSLHEGHTCYPEYFASGAMPLAAHEIDDFCERLETQKETTT